ncbi:MAG: hypothetical protein ACYTFW_05615 [Planctomycetota bacterium]
MRAGPGFPVTIADALCMGPLETDETVASAGLTTVFTHCRIKHTEGQLGRTDSKE